MSVEEQRKLTPREKSSGSEKKGANSGPQEPLAMGSNKLQSASLGQDCERPAVSGASDWLLWDEAGPGLPGAKPGFPTPSPDQGGWRPQVVFWRCCRPKSLRKT
ncbi:unnamed protein product [Rangifer tarandus platyrhynchus]|uniref:Uncharacterized protein n=1 Tax=Rangifer tarandus platyrhynchus TaxID=3082113 RepID=A0AC59ZSZ3_RANTA